MQINLLAPCNPLGYGVVGFNVLKSLSKAGHEVSYFPIGEPQGDGADFKALLEKTMKSSLLYDKGAPCIRVWHQNELNKFVGKGERIGWPIFELNSFTDQEKHQLNNVDKLFVCSSWAKEVCEDNDVNVPIHVVPLGVDSDVFYNDAVAKASRPYWTKDSTVFINVGKWEVRKGHNELCEAFSKAFKPEDDVELWMLNDNPFIGHENELWKRKYISSAMGHKIKILPRVNTQAELRAIFNKVDCGVFPSHAEGWNLEILELMACGAQIIATNYSGHTEFLNPLNSYLLDVNGIEMAQDGKWFHGQGQWATFDVDQLVEAMRAVHDQKQGDCFHVHPTVLADTVSKFSWDNTANCIEKAIK